MRLYGRMDGSGVNLESPSGGELGGTLGADVTPFRRIMNFAVFLQLRDIHKTFAAIGANKAIQPGLMHLFVVYV